MQNAVIQILPIGSGPHAFLGVTVTLHRFPPPAHDMLIIESHERNMVRDNPAEVARAAHYLDLMKAKSLGLEESTEFMRRVCRELPERVDTENHADEVP